MCELRHTSLVVQKKQGDLRFMTDFEIVRSSEIPSDIAPHRLEIHLDVFVKGCGDLLLR
jgi:hypothetical protein